MILTGIHKEKSGKKQDPRLSCHRLVGTICNWGRWTVDRFEDPGQCGVC